MKTFVALAVVALGIASAGSAFATTYTYAQADGTNPQLWSNPLCWSPQGVPGQGDTAIVVIGAPGAGAALEADGVTVMNLTLSGDGTTFIEGTGVTIQSGGTFDWKLGAEELITNLTIDSGATLTVEGDGDHNFSGTIMLEGTGNWTDGDISVTDDALLQNDGTLNITLGTTTFGAVQATGVLINNGTLHLLGAGTLTDSGSWAFHNNGTLTMENGIVWDWVNAGNTEHGLGPGGSITGSGTLSVSGLANVVLGGTHSIGSGITLDLDQTSSLFGAGTVTGAGNVILNGVLVEPSTTNADGGMTNDTITFATAVSIPASPAGDPGAGATPTMLYPGPGSVVFTGATSWMGSPLEINGGTVTNTGTWTIGARGILSEQTSSAIFQNNGTLTVDPVTGVLESDATLANAGTLDVKSGTLFLVFNGMTQTRGTTTVETGATLYANETLPANPFTYSTIDIQGGTLTGAGTVNATVTNEATVAPGSASAAGTLTIVGAYAQADAGVLNVGLGGTTAGSGYDVLAVGAGAALSGTMNVARIAGYVPAVSDSYTVVVGGDAGGVSGTFGSVAAPTGVTLTTTYTDANVVLGVTAVTGLVDAGVDSGVTTGFDATVGLPDTGVTTHLDAGKHSSDAGKTPPPVTGMDAAVDASAPASSSGGCSVAKSGERPTSDGWLVVVGLVTALGLGRRRNRP